MTSPKPLDLAALGQSHTQLTEALWQGLQQYAAPSELQLPEEPDLLTETGLVRALGQETSHTIAVWIPRKVGTTWLCAVEIHGFLEARLHIPGQGAVDALQGAMRLLRLYESDIPLDLTPSRGPGPHPDTGPPPENQGVADPIAHDIWQDRTGTTHDIRIGRPAQHPNDKGLWYCPVDIGPEHLNVQGVSALGTLRNGLRYLTLKLHADLESLSL